MPSFRVVSCFTGCPALELRLCQQQVHRLLCYGCVVLCVSQQCMALLDTCTPHPKKIPLGDTPIYHFHFNLHFLKAPLALCLSQAPRHSATSYAPACAPQVIVYFCCLLKSLLDFRCGACRFCTVDVDEATTAATDANFPLFACLACPRVAWQSFCTTFGATFVQLEW